LIQRKYATTQNKKNVVWMWRRQSHQ
jgi:hypothetical protein